MFFKNFTEFTGKHKYWGLLFNKVAGLFWATFFLVSWDMTGDDCFLENITQI